MHVRDLGHRPQTHGSQEARLGGTRLPLGIRQPEPINRWHSAEGLRWPNPACRQQRTGIAPMSRQLSEPIGRGTTCGPQERLVVRGPSGIRADANPAAPVLEPLKVVLDGQRGFCPAKTGADGSGPVFQRRQPHNLSPCIWSRCEGWWFRTTARFCNNPILSVPSRPTTVLRIRCPSHPLAKSRMVFFLLGRLKVRRGRGA